MTLPSRTLLASLSLVLALVSAGCFPSASKAILRDEDLARLSGDTKENCLVAAQINPMALGSLQSVKLATTGGEQAYSGSDASMFSAHFGGFAFVNVPKGPFRITYLNYWRDTVKGGREVNEFDTLNHGHNLRGNEGLGDVPNEMSGTCNGGFVWLGAFKGESGGLFSQPKVSTTSDAVTVGYSMRDLKAKLVGTPWEAEIDRPAENTPLPAGQVVVEKVDPVKAAAAAKAQAEAGQAAVAKMMAQSRPVTQPPSDAGALAAAAGAYVLEAINGKPIPYTYEANKCVMNDARFDLKADGSYTTAANMECAGAKYPFPTSGLFGIVAGTVTFAVAVGPPAAGVTKLDGGTLTTVAGPDTYTYKKH